MADEDCINFDEILDAYLYQEVIERDWAIFLRECVEVKQKGYYLKSASRRRFWPQVWVVEYRAMFIKPFIKIEGQVVFTEPETEWLTRP